MVKRKNLNIYLEFIQKEKNIEKEEILNETFIAAISPYLSGLMAATMILRYGTTIVQDYLTKAGRACNHLQGASKNLCVIDFKIRGTEQQLNALKSKKALCNKTRTPNECISKVQRKIDILQRQLKDLYEHKNIFRDKAQKEKQAQMRVM